MNTHTKKSETTISYDASRRLFADKLGHYALRKPKHFLQLDGFYMPAGGDNVMRPDEEGDCLLSGATVELMHGATVRVLIPYDTEALVAVRQLKKLAKWLKKKPDLMEYANPSWGDTQAAEDDELPF